MRMQRKPMRAPRQRLPDTVRLPLALLRLKLNLKSKVYLMTYAGLFDSDL